MSAPEQPGTQHAADAGADRIEEGDGERAHLQRKRLADGEVSGAGGGGSEEEDDHPGKGELTGRHGVDGEQVAGDRQ